ncbi:kinase-like domain-containing protein [Mycena belliarum]|uniref:Kinase-like domain-containing protein n=1 Tax=Mycena belliarum TaxID=1033014 RepID=A0AAD6TV00_9AGAR|nr:kinase-like domain-containing protein [Mycena belliae]
MLRATSYNLPDLTGELIDGGTLKIVCLLGAGAYGKVYKALDTASAPDAPIYYAVKCMPRHEPGSREAKMQEQELRLHRMVGGHPRVITFHRQFATHAFVFAVLDLSPGGDFFDALVGRRCFSENPHLIKTVIGELLDAVEFCHRNSVYHRDIKPENILCNSAGTDIRLADFGLATQIGVSRQFGCGSRIYMSPESIDRAYTNGCYSSRHSDLWAISIIFTNMISGRHPWLSAELSDAGFRGFRSENDYLLRTLKITRPANALLQRCFHMNPLRRPTLEEFRQAVDGIDLFSLEETPSAVPTSPPPQVPRLHFSVSPALSPKCVVAAPAFSTRELEYPKLTPIVAFHNNIMLHVPQPMKLAPLILRSCFSSSSSGSFGSDPSTSSSCPSLATSDSYAPSVSTASDLSSPATPFATDTDMRVRIVDLVAENGCGPLSAPRPRAHHGQFLFPCSSISTSNFSECHIVAGQVPPTLRRKKSRTVGVATVSK